MKTDSDIIKEVDSLFEDGKLSKEGTYAQEIIKRCKQRENERLDKLERFVWDEVEYLNFKDKKRINVPMDDVFILRDIIREKIKEMKK
jgi:hypothetical protein